MDLVAADEAGLFYGRATLAQLRRLHDGALPVGLIEDHPDIAVRGVMLDVSRDKVPTMATLCDLIDRLASWKVNHVQLYSEHTFAYADHPEVHGDSSPFTADEIRELDAFCRERHVELAPNQNCLGHMNRWLRHDRYRPLAAAPDGFVDPFGIARPAMTLEPSNPGSLALVRDLLAELVPLFSSRRVHLGLDEAWELPRERIPEYLAWMATLRSLPELDGREMLVWGDMLGGDPALVAQVPHGITVCEWGYDRSFPFDERASVLADLGVPFWVAPGTSSWLTIVGRVTNSVATCRQAAAAAIRHGGAGFLNTDWGDQGHLQQLPISDPGLAYGAAVSWCLEANAGIDLTAALSAHCYADPTGGLADALLVLGDLSLAVTPQIPNMSALVLHLYYPQLQVGRGLTKGITVGELDEVGRRLGDARTSLSRSRPARTDGGLLIDELRWSIDLVTLLIRDARSRLEGDGNLSSVPEQIRHGLAAELAGLIDRYRDLWAFRNRPGGLADSVAWLDNLGSAYATGRPDPTWAGVRIRT
ncbi:MAG: hypothetical protein NVSMB4_09590 [Acidimicrobiales bacterium]